jgi:hypothetical protein
VAASVQARKKLNFSTVFAGQAVGIKEVHDDIWLVSLMNYDLGYFDLETRVLEPLEIRSAQKCYLCSIKVDFRRLKKDLGDALTREQVFQMPAASIYREHRENRMVGILRRTPIFGELVQTICRRSIRYRGRRLGLQIQT